MKYLLHHSKRFARLTAIALVVAIPLFSFSQNSWSYQKELLSQLRTSNADTARVHILLKLGQYYLSAEHSLYQSSVAIANTDSASRFAEQALQLSRALQYENGKNEAALIKGDVLIRTNQTGSALTLLKSLQDPTRLRLLITLAQHYLFHTPRSDKNMDSALHFLQQADNITPDIFSDRWEKKHMRIKAMQAFITDGVQKCKTLYQELINDMQAMGNEVNEANAWHELAMLIPSRDTIGITRLNCLEHMVSLYKKTGDAEQEIGVLQSIADIHMIHGKLALAEAELLQVLERYKAINYPSLQWTYNLLASVHSKKGDFTKGIFYALKAVESMDVTGDYRPASNFYSHLGHMYRELGQPEKSVEWYSKIFINRDFYDRDNMYLFRDAGLLARQLIKLKKENDALAFILDIEARNKPIGPVAEASLLSSLAYCSYVLNHHQQADGYYSKLVKLTGLLNNDNEITTEVHYELGQYFLDKKQYGTAATYLQKALDAPGGINTLAVTKDIYLMLYKADSAQGNYFSAMQLLMKHKTLNDSIFNETKSRQIEELQVQYETAKKEKDIKLLSSQNQLQRIRGDEAIMTRNIMLAGVALLLIIVALLFNRYIIKKRSNQRLEAHQQELDEQNNFLEALNTEKDKLIEEKEWLIREVHHRVKNNLQMVTSLLRTQSAYLDNDAAVLAVKDSFRRMQAMSLIHQKLYMSKNISSIDMPEYVNELVSYLQDSFDTGNKIIFQTNIEPLTLDVSQAVPLGLIINESVVNSIKHAFFNRQKGTVNIGLQRNNADHLVLNISDNGIGLPETFDIASHNSLGLDLIRGLAKQLNATLEIKSNNGMHITIVFVAKGKEFHEKELTSF